MSDTHTYIQREAAAWTPDRKLGCSEGFNLVHVQTVLCATAKSKDSHVSVGDARVLTLQARELLDHLEGVLSNEPVEVVQGNSIVEVKPQGVSKGAVVDRLLVELAKRKDESGATGSPDFVLCIGDDRSDEDMFTAVEHVTVPANGLPEVRMQSRTCQCGPLRALCSSSNCNYIPLQ